MTQLVSFDTAASFMSPQADPEAPQFQNLVLAVSGAVESYLGTALRRATHVDFIDSNGGTRFYVRHAPIVSVTSFAYDPLGVFASTPTMSSDLWTFDDDSVIMRGGVRLSPGRRVVRIEYEAGYWIPGVDEGYDPLELTLPEPVIEATLRTIAALHSLGPNEAMQSESAGQVSVNRFAGPVAFDPYVQTLLAPYRRIW